MKITVTQEHIDKGERDNGGSCPVALAIQSTGHPLAGAMRVDSDAVWWMGEPGEDGEETVVHEVELPDEVRERIADFDGTGEMDPFEFDLDVTA